ncbi:MAG: hypothetical protein RR923_03005 [Bacilli bacterium]
MNRNYQNSNFFKFADFLALFSIGIIYLNYQENKRNVDVSIDNGKISKEISENLKKINQDGIVKRICTVIDNKDIEQII